MKLSLLFATAVVVALAACGKGDGGPDRSSFDTDPADGGADAPTAAFGPGGGPCGEGKKTTLRGTIYDPAGKTPLYGVAAFVPTAPIEPFAAGVACDRCGAKVSGARRCGLAMWGASAVRGGRCRAAGRLVFVPGAGRAGSGGRRSRRAR